MHKSIAEPGRKREILAADGMFRAERLGLAKPAALTVLALLGLLMIGLRPAQAQTETVLYSFTGAPDGAAPYYSGVVRDATGNFYGTTLAGGTYGFGTVYKLSSTGVETVLYSFTGQPDGASPYASLAMDKSGNLYGVTAGGGANGYGTVFKVTSSGTESVLYSFGGSPDGANPYKALALGKKGTLYGTTFSGGAYGFGTVFQLTAKGVETVLYSFTGGSDGAYPSAGVVLDKLGNLYGAATEGGTSGAGTVFELTPAGMFTVLYTFLSGTDGSQPYTTPILDKSGNVYGTTAGGGAAGCGTIYKLSTPSWTETQLHVFTWGDGCYADATLAPGKKQTLYSTTYFGGQGNVGTVFKVSSLTGAFTSLYSFTGSEDGAYPLAGVIFDKSGNVYSTTSAGGAAGYGTVFKLTP
jgi:uncharacterized repeat protein (TIGR03803 family)